MLVGLLLVGLLVGLRGGVVGDVGGGLGGVEVLLLELGLLGGWGLELLGLGLVLELEVGGWGVGACVLVGGGWVGGRGGGVLLGLGGGGGMRRGGGMGGRGERTYFWEDIVGVFWFDAFWFWVGGGGWRGRDGNNRFGGLFEELVLMTLMELL